MTFALVGLATLAATLGETGRTEPVSPVRGAECYADAARAADRAYGKHYRDDWYIDLRAIVHANDVRSIEVHVGPYDGSVGGGFSATFNCATRKVILVEQER